MVLSKPLVHGALAYFVNTTVAAGTFPRRSATNTVFTTEVQSPVPTYNPNASSSVSSASSAAINCQVTIAGVPMPTLGPIDVQCADGCYTAPLNFGELIPGATSQYQCRASQTVQSAGFVEVTSTCAPGSTVTMVTPLFGPLWPKCTGV